MNPPEREDVEKLGSELYFDLSEEEIVDYQKLLAGVMESYETVSEYRTESPLDSPSNRDSGMRVVGEDPHNAWITRCSISESDTGQLAGWEISIKDNIAVGGIEMTCGSGVVSSYVPKEDATLVSRLLSEGATIVGKTNLDDMAFSGNGHTSTFGPMLNPHDREFLAGGSSGGSAISVAIGEVDAAIGSDQGGSIRVPASWCGVVGHKPTHGLVPYTGCIGIDNTIDHAGPLAGDVETAAEILTVIAGRDRYDPRQPENVPVEDYASALGKPVEDLNIATVQEGFNGPECSSKVNDRVWSALERLEDRGATVEQVSIPIHSDAPDIYTVSLVEGFFAAIQGEGLGHNWKGWYNTDWAREFGNRRRKNGESFPPTVKLVLLAGAYANANVDSQYYPKAMNLRSDLTETYDKLLEEYDLIAMPTTPMIAHRWKPEQTRIEYIGDAWTNLANTSAFNMTGHPSVSVPVNPVEELPVGLMLTGRPFDDATVLNGAHAVESS